MMILTDGCAQILDLNKNKNEWQQADDFMIRVRDEFGGGLPSRET